KTPWTYKNFFFIICFISITILTSGYILLKTFHSNSYSQLFLLPLLYGLFMLVFPSMWRYQKGHIGLTIFNIVLFIRYCFSPFIKAITYNHNTSLIYVPSSSGITTGIWIMIIELLFSFIIVSIFAKIIYKDKINGVNYKSLNSKFILFL